VKAVLLAAGRGTRLAPLTDSVPKILAPLAGSSLLEHQLRYLARSGVTEVAINVHHMADKVVEALDRMEPPLAVRVSREPELLGTAGALRPLARFLDEPFALLYGDVVTDADLSELIGAHRESGAVATLAYYRSDETEGKGLLEIDAGGMITGFAEKPAGFSGIGNVNAGIYALSPEILERIGPGARDFGHDVWPAMLAEGAPIHAHEIHAYLRDIGSPQALEAAERDLMAGAVRW
jgi:mannose-1-phosphate guanylyltransferase